MSDDVCPKCGSGDLSMTMTREISPGGERASTTVTCNACEHEWTRDD